jgi:1-acyl-sn-glycerol-3-phosphate acyltransferase
MDPWLTVLSALGLLLAAVLIWFALVVRSTEYTPLQTFFWLFAKFYTRVMWRMRVEGTFPLDGGGNAVVICNHRSSVDPFFVQVASKRVIRWMVAREYCEHPILGPLLSIACVIPVNRGGVDTASTKAAIRVVAEGGMVGMLPEGRINVSDNFMNPVRPGAIIVALKGRSPIVPCYIENAPYGGKVWSPFVMRTRSRIKFGPPIDLTPYYGQEKDDELVRRLAIECVTAIARLAGRDDFVPELAGRKWKTAATDESATPETT